MNEKDYFLRSLRWLLQKFAAIEKRLKASAEIAEKRATEVRTDAMAKTAKTAEKESPAATERRVLLEDLGWTVAAEKTSSAPTSLTNESSGNSSTYG